MTILNKHGLSRDIPAEVRREVRQRCGFGCVHCGNAVVQYDHFDPEFADAIVHDPQGIILLCGSCHNLKTIGRLSRETLRKSISKPCAKKKGFSFGPFDIGTEPPEISFGPIQMKNVRHLLSMAGDDNLSIAPPAIEGGPFLIDALFLDSDGKPILQIVQNEWRSRSNNWDVEVKGDLITIRKAHGHLVLMIRTIPPNQLLVVQLLMFHRGWRISCKESGPIKFTGPMVDQILVDAARIENTEFGVVLDRSGIFLGKNGYAGSLVTATFTVGGK